jgi:hypothetical protein
MAEHIRDWRWVASLLHHRIVDAESQGLSGNQRSALARRNDQHVGPRGPVVASRLCQPLRVCSQ